MSLKAKDLLIVVMALFIVALLVLMYKVNKLVVESLPKHIPTEVYVMDLTEALNRQNQSCADLSYTTGWLKRHLDSCLTLLESERGLEPIPDTAYKPYPVQGQVEQQDSAKPSRKTPEPFFVPYEKPKPYFEKSSEEHDLSYLTCMTNMATMAAFSSRHCVEVDIDNLQQRLKRIAPDPNSMK